MCLRMLLGNHQKVSVTKLLKSLYPTVQSTNDDERGDNDNEVSW